MQPKTKQKTEQRRVADLNVTSSADGSVLHTAIEIRDHQVGALKYWRVTMIFRYGCIRKIMITATPSRIFMRIL